MTLASTIAWAATGAIEIRKTVADQYEAAKPPGATGYGLSVIGDHVAVECSSTDRDIKEHHPRTN